MISLLQFFINNDDHRTPNNNYILAQCINGNSFNKDVYIQSTVHCKIKTELAYNILILLTSLHVTK